MQFKGLQQNSMFHRIEDEEGREAKTKQQNKTCWMSVDSDEESCLKSSVERAVAVLGISDLTFEHISS